MSNMTLCQVKAGVEMNPLSSHVSAYAFIYLQCVFPIKPHIAIQWECDLKQAPVHVTVSINLAAVWISKEVPLALHLMPLQRAHLTAGARE